MKKIVILILAVLLIIAGTIILPLPIPLGIIMITVGIGIAVMVSPMVKRTVLEFRGHHPGLEAAIDKIKKYLPGFLRKPIQDSDPDEHQDPK